MDWLDHLAAYTLGGLIILVGVAYIIFMFGGPFMDEEDPGAAAAGCGCVTLIIGIIALAIIF